MNEKARARRAAKPSEWRALFSGNTDDHFRLGIKITRGSIRQGPGRCVNLPWRVVSDMQRRGASERWLHAQTQNSPKFPPFFSFFLSFFLFLALRPFAIPLLSPAKIRLKPCLTLH